ncbi:hypothetical protein, variant [Aphanomyces astaci]|nr:hypothetical protein, variant [Aphanomyces astaci]ETV73737.1 hypothetical protein, variant [Aphanomyces astaci]|eukprot:XP_009836672.1 hypothetical protein, variant [Aphanomyces astaci]
MATSPQQADAPIQLPADSGGGLPPSGRQLLRELWSLGSQDEESTTVDDEEWAIRPSFQSSVSSARSSVANDQERRTFSSFENGISNLDVDLAIAPGSPHVVHDGWLIKRGHNWHTWKKRWFVLTSDAKLEYFKKSNRKKSKGKVDLNDGIVQVQFVDVHRVEHTYAFCITKGFYTLLCSCETGDEADTWVRHLRHVRLHPPPEYEGLDRHVGAFDSEATMATLLGSETSASPTGWTAQMLRFQRRVLSSTSGFTPVTTSSILAVQSVATPLEGFKAGTILSFVHFMTQQIVTSHMSLFTTGEYRVVPFDAIMGIHVVLEDRIFLPLQDTFHRHLHDVPTSRVQARLAILQSLPAGHIFDAAVLATADTDWSDAIATFSALDTASLPTHKMRIFQRAVDMLGSKFAAAPAAYRYMCIHASVVDLAVQAAILRLVQKYLPFPGLDGPVQLLVDAVAWVADFNITTPFSPSSSPSSMLSSVASPTSVVSVTFATPDLGIQFVSHLPQDRGARVAFVLKYSQANLSATVQPGLVLVAINDTFVAVSTLPDIVSLVRRAKLPKRLLFVADIDGFLSTACYHYLLCSAADRGDLATVRFIVDQNTPQLNLHGPCLWTPTALAFSANARPPPTTTTVPDLALHAAVRGGNVDLVRYLVDDVALDANQRTNYQLTTPLHMLVANVAEIAPLLLSYGAIVDLPDKDGRTPLLVQCRAGSKEGVVTLVGLGASVRALAWATGTSPLIECVRRGDLSLVDFLLLKGASVSAATNNKETALHVAASTGHVDVIARLVAAGASLTAGNRDGWIPAMVFLSNYRKHASDGAAFLRGFRLLVADPATMRCSDVWGRYVVHFAATSLDPKTMKDAMELCLEKGADGHVEDVFGDTAKDYRKHPRDHGEYVPPTSYMKHLHVSLVELGDLKRWRIQNGKIEDILAYLVADKSTCVHEMVSFVLNFQAYMDITDLLALFKAKFGHPDAKSKLKQAWSAWGGGGSLQRDNHCGGMLFLSLVGVLYPDVVTTDAFADCVAITRASMPMVHLQMAKLSAVYNVGPPSTLYEDLYQHMTEMYAARKPLTNDLNDPLPRLSLTTTTAFDFARHVTLLSHALFCRIPIRQLLLPKCQDIGFLSARHWFQHLSDVVTNSILLQDSPSDRVRVICFFIDVAEICFAAFQNFDSFIAIVYALQSTPIFRLKITFGHLGREYTGKLRKLQVYTQSGSR